MSNGAASLSLESTPAISINNLRKSFGSLEVLKGVSLKANEGDVISILFGFLQRHIFACQAYSTHTAAGRGWFAELGCPLVEYAASLRFQTSAPLTPKGRARTS
jgi:hypothetical protein